MIPLASLLIRSGVILLAAEALRRGLGASPAARRHGVVLFALALVIDWPLFATILPAISVRWPELAWLWWLGMGSAGGGRGMVTVSQSFRAAGRHAPTWVSTYWPVLAWAAGAAMTVTPFAIGALRVRGLARRAKPLEDGALHQLVIELSRKLHMANTPEVLLLTGPAMPMTFGLLRPKIVLPDAALSWTQTRQRAVLLHELAHVRRRDVASQLIAQLATALWWFQPMAWISRRSLRRESERACDELVLRHGVPATEYAAELLEIAKTFGGGARWAAGIPMASATRCGELEERLHNILRGTRARKGPGLIRFSAALSCLAVLTMATSAVTLSPQTITDEQRSSTMTLSSFRRSVLSGLLASAGLSAATIGGSLLDPHGAPVADAKASLYDPASAVKKEATTTADGKFVFESLPAGHYILRVEKAGYPALYREFKVADDSKVDHGLTLGDAAKNTEANPKQLRIGGEMAEANLIYKLTPVYPAAAKEARIQGKVQLEMVISEEGLPQDIRVISSPSDDLSQSALEAVAQWRYRPTLLNGDPIPVITEVTVNYTLVK